jgi:hypothetical protein
MVIGMDNLSSAAARFWDTHHSDDGWAIDIRIINRDTIQAIIRKHDQVILSCSEKIALNDNVFIQAEALTERVILLLDATQS